ncbi:preprotein translocase subunit SecG [Peptococcaceae bacterium]|nr:preprotein translocase subunit SecG [Peptococcaceae bacterium]
MLEGIINGFQLLVALLLIASVLLQSGKSAGVSGSIAGGAETLFGKKKGLDERLARVTTVLAVVFGVLCLIAAAI